MRLSKCGSSRPPSMRTTSKNYSGFWEPRTPHVQYDGRRGLLEDGEYTSAERTVVEAVLKADGSGQLVKFPFINNQLQRILCRWAYKLCTAGGFRLPAFALADDGYLVLHNGRVYSGSDWMPEDHAITSLGSARLLEVRYPIRAKDDLLPLKNLHGPDTVARSDERPESAR